MSWHTAEMIVGTPPAATPLARSGGLGSASAACGVASAWSGEGGWWQPRSPSGHGAPIPSVASAPAPHVLRVPRDVLRMMAEAAWAAGRGEEEIWIEAAREWLRRRARDDEPPPSAPAAAWPVAARGTRAWAAIDALLAELRSPAPAPLAPAASAADAGSAA
ncbi:MAG: hypothetical protein IVW57_01150 [Ktedonobacterales bacterium]|nr:hypothetical protein [Ktedonobacterales bacterium]